jgi:hypothetical protein
MQIIGYNQKEKKIYHTKLTVLNYPGEIHAYWLPIWFSETKKNLLWDIGFTSQWQVSLRNKIHTNIKYVP